MTANKNNHRSSFSFSVPPPSCGVAPVSLTSDSRLLSRADMAKLLGVSLRTVDNLVASDGIPSLKVGASRRFDRDTVAAWLRAGCPGKGVNHG